MGDRLSPVFFRAHPTAIAVPFLLLRLVIARLSNNFIAPTGCQPVLVKMVVKTSPEAPVMSPVSPHGLKTRDTLSAFGGFPWVPKSQESPAPQGVWGFFTADGSW
jgi:hypothetical protein